MRLVGAVDRHASSLWYFTKADGVDMKGMHGREMSAEMWLDVVLRG